ncbi:MAG: branched-chain amino acid ABC transporter permease [Pseudobdellovibrionaceae bacterium]|nr:branched-chain amino acid ABC transporter permease [Pseudobdellovibrionaceae bacterium]
MRLRILSKQLEKILLCSAPLGIVGGVILIGIVLHFFADSFVQLLVIYVLINMLLALGLNLVSGMTGQLSLGHAGLMAVGAYTSSFFAKQMGFTAQDFHWYVYLIFNCLGGCSAALVGLLVGAPSLRLRGDYLAIVTLGFGEVIRVLLLNLEVVGGARGYYDIPGRDHFITNYLVCLAWVVFLFFLLWRMRFSIRGQQFLAVRDDELAAQFLGIDIARTKVLAFLVSSFFAGVGGSLFAHFVRYLNPSSFSFQKSVEIVIMVVLGGSGSISGAALGAVIVTLLPELLRPIQDITGFDLRLVIYAVILILLMIFRPQGLFNRYELKKPKWLMG